MAWIKTKSVKGYEANYWRFLELHTNMNREDAVCVFGLYKDQETRNSDPEAVIQTFQFNLNNEVLGANARNDTVKNINISKAYSALKHKADLEVVKLEEEQDKSLSFFSDAVEG